VLKDLEVYHRQSVTEQLLCSQEVSKCFSDPKERSKGHGQTFQKKKQTFELDTNRHLNTTEV
jgi:hypothetical protein